MKRCCMVFGLLLLFQAASAQKVLRNIDVITSDGDSLATDIYIPNGNGSFPVILMRTPYDKSKRDYGDFFNKEGYVYIVQDVRGKYESSGEFRAWIDERLDGYETLDWIQAQPWCDGNIGLLGSSYSGYSAMQLAPSRHPALKAIVNNSGPGDMYTVIYPGGVFHNTAILPWTMAITHNKTRYFPPYQTGLSINDLVEFKPLNDAFIKNNYVGTFWNYLINHQTKDPYWQSINLSNYDKISIPIQHITGWYDFICTSALDSYFEISGEQKKNLGETNQELIIGPWVHDAMKNGITKVGDTDFGEVVKVGKDRHYTEAVEFFDRYLKPDNTISKSSPDLRIFELGSNQWKSFNEWPATNPLNMYLSSTKGANSLDGDGFLSEDISNERSIDKFTFDPENPVPTKGGANIHFAFFGEMLGIRDQRQIEKRNDVLVYTSNALKSKLNVLGKIKAHLYVSTDADDSDFTAKIVEVKEDGTANIIQEGIQRLRFTDSFEKASFKKPGEVTAIEIDMGYISIEIQKGSQIRVEISGSNSPKYALNPNTKEDPMTTRTFKKANQSIFMSKDYPSRIVLPILQN